VAIKAIVFDLDDTLLDTTGLLIPIARTPAFHDRIRQPLPLLDGAKENLEVLSKKYNLYLLTQGHVESQQAKVKSCGITHYFKDFFFTDPTKNESKYDYFLQLKKSLGLKDGEFLSIGNRRSTDIRGAKKVGGLTCLFKYGEHQNELPEVPEDNADFEVLNHSELIRKCHL